MQTRRMTAPRTVLIAALATLPTLAAIAIMQLRDRGKRQRRIIELDGAVQVGLGVSRGVVPSAQIEIVRDETDVGGARGVAAEDALAEVSGQCTATRELRRETCGSAL